MERSKSEKDEIDSVWKYVIQRKFKKGIEIQISRNEIVQTKRKHESPKEMLKLIFKFD